MKCANCSAEATYTVTNPASRPVHYCNACLPKHLRERARAGHFPLQAPLKTEPTAKKSKKKSAPAEDVEAVEEQEVVEDAPGEDI